jgi:hypothetical protein
MATHQKAAGLRQFKILVRHAKGSTAPVFLGLAELMGENYMVCRSTPLEAWRSNVPAKPSRPNVSLFVLVSSEKPKLPKSRVPWSGLWLRREFTTFMGACQQNIGKKSKIGRQ